MGGIAENNEVQENAPGQSPQPPVATPLFHTLSEPIGSVRRYPSDLGVGGGSQTVLEQELDDAIRDLQTAAALAEDRGDIETALDLSRRRLDAIASRTHEHTARIDQEDRQRIDDGLDYFQSPAALAQGRRRA